MDGGFTDFKGSCLVWPCLVTSLLLTGSLCSPGGPRGQVQG